MKRIITLAAVLLMSLSLAAATNAAPQPTSTAPKSPVGLQNSKKAMQGKAERDKKVREVSKKAHAKRQQAQK